MVTHKYRAKQTVTDGIKFSSKMEARYYEQLKLRQQAGDVLFFLRQVPFHLPANIKYVVDFVEFLADGSVEIIDVKGYDTPVSKIKRKQVEDLYPVKVKLVTKV